ncbi:MAG TPA: BlaI/MecI/CopY family transcriptional regulator [Fimbriimonas sp.]|nr:BlaI/MecI/CopY family transcriptional regulator [Fimbriimonas sp.]
MPRMIGHGLSRREREVLDALHRLGKATAVEVMENMPTPPSYSAVRSILRILEDKGHVKHEEDGKRYLYLPAESRQSAARSALDQVMTTFFGGSLEVAVRTFLDDQDADLSDDELDRLSAIIDQARRSKETPR